MIFLRSLVPKCGPVGAEKSFEPERQIVGVDGDGRIVLGGLAFMGLVHLGFRVQGV